MSVVCVLDQSETDFCGINEGPINLSISINTFPHERTNIYQTRGAHDVIYGSA